MRSVSPIFRLSVGLILLTVSLLLVGDLIGLTPDQKRAEITARKAIAESLAVQISNDVSDNRIGVAEETLKTLQGRNDSVLSVALRANDSRLLAIAGDHTQHWNFPGKDVSTASYVQVPIFSEAGRWGTLEVAFSPLASPLDSLFKGGSLATVILFIAVSGFVAYWLFLKRALNELDPSAVVPDRVRAALDVLAEGLVILDRNGVIVLVNAAFERKFGRAASSLIGTRLASLDWEKPTDADTDGDDAVALPWLPLLNGGDAPPPTQLKLNTALQERLSFAVHVAPIKAQDDAIRGAVVTFDDVTELERKNVDLERALERLKHSQREISRQNRELQVLATRDPLTGVLNRRSLFDGLTTLIKESAEEGEPLSCIMVDIDHFKSINDRFGHATGDKVIKLLAQLLTDVARSDDLVGRYGGEEFCVILPGMDELPAAEIAEQMRVAVAEGKQGDLSDTLRISASFGVSTDTGRLTAGALIDQADKALYEAKETGRNRVVRSSQLDQSDKAPNVEASPQEKPPSQPVDDAAVDAVCEALDERLRDGHDSDDLVEVGASHRTGDPGTVLDDVSDLPTRIVLLDRIRQGVERSSRFGTRIAVLSIDVDTIQVVRNTLGNAVAEKLTRAIVKRLKQTVRSTDTIAIEGADTLGVSVSRIGGGEFVVLLTEMQDTECTTWIVQRLFASLKEIVEVDGNEVVLDTSIGVSLYPNDGEEPEVLLENAGAALHEAKADTRRDVCLFYSNEINRRSKEHLRMEAQLQGAIERGELFLEFQPLVDLRRCRITAFEALLRWRHPEWGLVPPLQFIPVAEHTGMITKIEAWVLKTALNQLRNWYDSGHDRISMTINLSASEFRESNLAEKVVAAIDEAGVPRSSLILEITETILIQNLEAAVDLVEQFNAAGVRVALDDFGTGYSSLSYLKRFPIDIVKIDKSFLRDFPEHAHDTAIVTAIIAMAHSLGLLVVAEGVENEHQLAVLDNLQCNEVQGFLLSRPVSRQEASNLLAHPAGIRRVINDATGGSDKAVQPDDARMLEGVLNDAVQRGVSL